MTLFTIDTNKCKKDGLCAAVCPRTIIDISVKETFPQPTADAEELCIQCGHCAAVCPHGALHHNDFDCSSWPTFDRSKFPAQEQLVQLIRGRRSTRVYKEAPPERKAIEKLIKLARYAPTARNTQMIQWLVIDNASELSALKNHTIDWMRDALDRNDPGAVAYGFQDVLDAWEEGRDPILRGAPELIILHTPAAYPFGLVDSTIAATTFELAATAEGLATCWAGFFMIAAKSWKPLREALSLPQGNELTVALMTGSPKYRYARLPERKPPVIDWR